MKQKWFYTLASVLLLTMSQCMFAQKRVYVNWPEDNPPSWGVKPYWGKHIIQLTHPDVVIEQDYDDRWWWKETERLDNQKSQDEMRKEPGTISELPAHDPPLAYNVIVSMQDPEGFLETAKSCFTSKELKMFAKADVWISLSPVMVSDGSIREMDEIAIESMEELKANAVRHSSLEKLENAFCEYFTFNDGGLRGKLQVYNDIVHRAFSLHFAPDGSVSVHTWAKSIPWINNPETQAMVKRLNEAWYLDY